MSKLSHPLLHSDLQFIKFFCIDFPQIDPHSHQEIERASPHFTDEIIWLRESDVICPRLCSEINCVKSRSVPSLCSCASLTLCLLTCKRDIFIIRLLAAYLAYVTIHQGKAEGYKNNNTVSLKHYQWTCTWLPVNHCHSFALQSAMKAIDSRMLHAEPTEYELLLRRAFEIYAQRQHSKKFIKNGD